MPFNQTTPESMLGRADSKSPASTCRGMTSSGKACRRAIAKDSLRNLKHGVVAVSSSSSGRLSDAAFYCWQHKEQAGQFAQAKSQSSAREHTTILPVEGRTSIDSLVARLGVASLSERQHSYEVSQQEQQRRSDRSDGLHRAAPPYPQYQRPPRPAYVSQARPRSDRLEQNARPKNSPRFWASLCCVADLHAEDDRYEVIRHRERAHGVSQPEMTFTGPSMVQSPYSIIQPPASTWQQRPLAMPNQSHQSVQRKPHPQQRRPLAELPARPSNIPHSSSQTQTLLSYIPPSLSPKKTSLLLKELSKPISPSDEAGYIYIFWLTPPSTTTPPRETASRLLSTSNSHTHAINDLVRRHSTSTNKNATQKTIMLKIGRANNVHRRMTEWTRQCGYDLNVVRWYPYISSSPASSPVRSASGEISPSGVRKVPHAHRVERLIHLELSERRVRKLCKACGREHREWFEVEASEAGVRGVDEVVRRWVAWAEKTGVENT